MNASFADDPVWRFASAAEADTERLAAALAAALPARLTVALRGPLGAGKTRFTQALAAACGAPRDEVVSPTFVLCQEYRGARRIYHLDAYRLRGPGDLLDLGVEECFAAPALTIIEWADKVADCLPAPRLEIDIEHAGPTARVFRLRAVGDEAEAALRAAQANLARTN